MSCVLSLADLSERADQKVRSERQIVNRKWLLAACFSLLTLHMSFFTALFAADRTNVPLKNWGGFSVNRSWVYDALEKIVLAGLAEQALLNTKPLSRVEAARIVAQAVRRLGWDQYGDYNHRGYLEDILYQLVEEFGPELAEMGVRTSLNRDVTTGFFGLKPIDHVQFGIDLASRAKSLVNNSGRRVTKGGNRTSTLDGRLHVGDFFSLYYQPEVSWGEASQGRLQTGYAKFTLWDVDLQVGRDSLWWGPGYRGSMLFSNNSRPLEQVRLSSAEPTRLPWFLSYLGPIKASFLVARLEEERDFPHAHVAGYRFNLAPFRYVELGYGRAFQFGGDGRGFKGKNFPKVLFWRGSDNPNSSLSTNNLQSIDITVRIPDAEKYIVVSRDLAFYGEMGWDDTLFGEIVPDRPGGIVGAYFAGFLGDPKLDLRVEYARSSEIMFNHTIYTTGFTHRGSVLSHFIGNKGSELFARLSRWISPDLLLGFQLSQAEIGPTAAGLLGLPREKRYSLGLDLSYRVSDRSSIFLGYDFARIKDRGFVAGQSGNDNLFRIEFTRSIGQ